MDENRPKPEPPEIGMTDRPDSTDQTRLKSAPSRLKRGQRLGKYRLVHRLGVGGYCEVWKARDSVEGIWVALKIPQADPHGKRDNQQLIREVRLVSRLRHPNILPVKNAAIFNGHAVLATELSVKTLDDFTRPMAPRRIIQITADVLRGLAHAHHNRVVHCDVTPGNIFLLSDGRAAIGDFGIGVKVEGRMKTLDDYGTPGYVSPEQAYGKPTYRSDGFSVALILYEFLTGHLPAWPFKWPMKGHDRLKEKTGAAFVQFMKKALSVDPEYRFADAGRMLAAMQEALPRHLRANGGHQSDEPRRKVSWRQLRRDAFLKRYGKLFPAWHDCVDCGEAIAESMQICPWCGSDRNRFEDRTWLSHYCTRCRRGLSPRWSYCPWCYGSGYEPQPEEPAPSLPVHDRCRHCGERLTRFMRYCPSCRRKVSQKWQVWPFPEVCSHCGWSVDASYWNYCPWCAESLLE